MSWTYYLIIIMSIINKLARGHIVIIRQNVDPIKIKYLKWNLIFNVGRY